MRDGFPPKFPLSEFLKSATAERLGIPNVPTPAHEANLRALAWHVLHPLRQAMGGPIRISSGYRSPKLNANVDGASKTSQHSLGQAADLVPGDGATFSTADLFHHIRQHLPFDQLIWEHGTAKAPEWVHVSFVGVKRRAVILRATGTKTDPVYTPWTP